MTNTNNPLSQFYRTVKVYTKLPSNGVFYSEDIIVLNDDNEIGIMPMTGRDEINLKNPDMLLNGDATRSLLMSCVPGLKDPNRLLINDIDALLVAIKLASYGDSQTLTSPCPKCNHDNQYDVNFTNVLEQMNHIDENNIAVLSSGASVFVKPFAFKEKMLAAKKTFEQTKVAKQLSESNASEEDQLSSLSKTISMMADMSYTLLASCVVKIVHQEHNLEFINDKANKEIVEEFLINIEKKDADAIDAEINSINSTGVSNKFHLTCEKCKEKWDSELSYDSADFFTNS